MDNAATQRNTQAMHQKWKTQKYTATQPTAQCNASIPQAHRSRACQTLPTDPSKASPHITQAEGCMQKEATMRGVGVLQRRRWDALPHPMHHGEQRQSQGPTRVSEIRNQWCAATTTVIRGPKRRSAYRKKGTGRGPWARGVGEGPPLPVAGRSGARRPATDFLSPGVLAASLENATYEEQSAESTQVE